jgi:cytidylate kinase
MFKSSSGLWLPGSEAQTSTIQGGLPRIVAVNGDPGAGKTELSRMLAERLSYRHVTSGMFFCALGEVVRNMGVSFKDGARVAEITELMEVAHDLSDPSDRLMSVNGIDLSGPGELFKVTNKSAATELTKHAAVRAWGSRQIQALIAEVPADEGIIFDRGYNVGASLEIKLTGHPAVLAQRRMLQMQTEGQAELSYDEIYCDIAARITEDNSRKDQQSVASIPTYPINTTHLSLEQVYAIAAPIITGDNSLIPATY